MSLEKIGEIFTINQEEKMEVVNKIIAKVKSDRKVQIGVAVAVVIIIALIS
jgi:dihydrodipicolinate synthase/N-acetylneuraminate lyase